MICCGITIRKMTPSSQKWYDYYFLIHKSRGISIFLYFRDLSTIFQVSQELKRLQTLTLLSVKYLQDYGPKYFWFRKSISFLLLELYENSSVENSYEKLAWCFAIKVKHFDYNFERFWQERLSRLLFTYLILTSAQRQINFHCYTLLGNWLRFSNVSKFKFNFKKWQENYKKNTIQSSR